MSERVVIHTTKERIDALREFLAHEYLGHKQRDELVRALLKDADEAIEKRAALFPTK